MLDVLIAITVRLDQIIGLILSIAGLAYLTYTMLRPEKF